MSKFILRKQNLENSHFCHFTQRYSLLNGGGGFEVVLSIFTGKENSMPSIGSNIFKGYSMKNLRTVIIILSLHFS